MSEKVQFGKASISHKNLASIREWSFEAPVLPEYIPPVRKSVNMTVLKTVLHEVCERMNRRLSRLERSNNNHWDSLNSVRENIGVMRQIMLAIIRTGEESEDLTDTVRYYFTLAKGDFINTEMIKDVGTPSNNYPGGIATSSAYSHITTTRGRAESGFDGEEELANRGHIHMDNFIQTVHRRLERTPSDGQTIRKHYSSQTMIPLVHHDLIRPRGSILINKDHDDHYQPVYQQQGKSKGGFDLLGIRKIDYLEIESRASKEALEILRKKNMVHLTAEDSRQAINQSVERLYGDAIARENSQEKVLVGKQHSQYHNNPSAGFHFSSHCPVHSSGSKPQTNKYNSTGIRAHPLATQRPMGKGILSERKSGGKKKTVLVKNSASSIKAFNETSYNHPFEKSLKPTLNDKTTIFQSIHLPTCPTKSVALTYQGTVKNKAEVGQGKDSVMLGNKLIGPSSHPMRTDNEKIMYNNNNGDYDSFINLTDYRSGNADEVNERNLNYQSQRSGKESVGANLNKTEQNKLLNSLIHEKFTEKPDLQKDNNYKIQQVEPNRPLQIITNSIKNNQTGAAATSSNSKQSTQPIASAPNIREQPAVCSSQPRHASATVVNHLSRKAANKSDITELGIYPSGLDIKLIPIKTTAFTNNIDQPCATEDTIQWHRIIRSYTNNTAEDKVKDERETGSLEISLSPSTQTFPDQRINILSEIDNNLPPVKLTTLQNPFSKEASPKMGEAEDDQIFPKDITATFGGSPSSSPNVSPEPFHHGQPLLDGLKVMGEAQDEEDYLFDEEDDGLNNAVKSIRISRRASKRIEADHHHLKNYNAEPSNTLGLASESTEEIFTKQNQVEKVEAYQLSDYNGLKSLDHDSNKLEDTIASEVKNTLVVSSEVTQSQDNPQEIKPTEEVLPPWQTNAVSTESVLPNEQMSAPPAPWDTTPQVPEPPWATSFQSGPDTTPLPPWEQTPVSQLQATILPHSTYDDDDYRL